MDFFTSNWQWVLVVFYIFEKIVKITPVVWDDILVDGIKSICTALYNALKRT